MTTTGPDGGQQGLRPSLDDPNETPGTKPAGEDDLHRGLTLTSGGNGDDLDDGDDDDDDDDDIDDDDDDDEDDEDDGGDGASELNPA
ncbi:MAG TPA: hypothetical protein VGK84_08475 [Candidatus Tumulicola sp.]